MHFSQSGTIMSAPPGPHSDDRVQRDFCPAMTGEIVVDDIAYMSRFPHPGISWLPPGIAEPFGHQKTYLITPSVHPVPGKFRRLHPGTGTDAGGDARFSLPLRLGAHSAYWNAPLRAAGIPASLPGALDAVFDAGQVHIIVLLSYALVRETWPADFVSSLERALASRWLPTHPHAAARLAGRCWRCWKRHSSNPKGSGTPLPFVRSRRRCSTGWHKRYGYP